MPLRKWRPVGPDETVVMDKDQLFVGDQSPRIQVEQTSARGIRQSGLTLVKGKQYTGRIYLRSTAGTQVKVALVWGASENDRQTVSVPRLTSDYTKFPLTFTAKADTTEGVLEVTGSGAGNSTSAQSL
jgi:alpha-L-arabinofuranosidase